jgi:hypothetical protein
VWQGDATVRSDILPCSMARPRLSILGDQWNNNATVQAFFHRLDWAVASLLVAGASLSVFLRWRGMRRGR